MQEVPLFEVTQMDIPKLFQSLLRRGRLFMIVHCILIPNLNHNFLRQIYFNAETKEK